MHADLTALAVLLALHTGVTHSADQPLAIIDLGTREGAALVQGQWRYSDARIVETDFFAPGPEG
jgi:hypothetical protein